MKKLMALSLAVSFAVISSVAMADVTVDMQLNIEGREVRNHCVFNEVTPVCSLEDSGFVIETTALQTTDEEMVMNVKVFRKQETGETTLVADPIITTAWGQEATLELRNESGESISMAIVASK